MRIFRYSSFEIKNRFTTRATSFAKVNHSQGQKSDEGAKFQTFGERRHWPFSLLQKKSDRGSFIQRNTVFHRYCASILEKISSFPLWTRVFCWIEVALLGVRVPLKALEWVEFPLPKRIQRLKVWRFLPYSRRSGLFSCGTLGSMIPAILATLLFCLSAVTANQATRLAG